MRRDPRFSYGARLFHAWGGGGEMPTARLRALITSHRAYLGAVSTGYAQMSVAVVVQLLMIPLYLKHLDEYRFGVFMMMLSFSNFAAFGVVWLTGTMQKTLADAYARQDEADFSTLYAVSKWLFVGYALVTAVLVGGAFAVVVAAMPDLADDRRASVLWGIGGTALFFVASYVLSIDRVALTARGDQATANLLTILAQVVFAVGAVPVLMAGGDLVHLMLMMAAGMVVAVIAGRVVLRRRGLYLTALVRPVHGHRAVVRRLAGRTGGAYMIYGTLALVLQADILIVGWLAGPVIAGQFVLVWRIAELTVMALWRLADSQVPFLMHRDARGEIATLRKGLQRSLLFMWGICGAAGLGYALLGQWVVGLWVGAENAPQVTLAYVLAGTAIIWLGVARAPMVVAYATARLRVLNLVMAAELAGKLVLLALLFPHYGFLAPLIAINVLHAGGLAALYIWAGFRSLGAARLDSPQGHRHA